eukprot:scaffold2123_cov96-Cylindrotheca_fusiformis.AAC.3
MVQLRNLMDESPLAATTTQVDKFGRTPRHFLSLSQTPNLDMLLASYDERRQPGDHIFLCIDSFGFTPMDYFSCSNRISNSCSRRYEGCYKRQFATFVYKPLRVNF